MTSERVFENLKAEIIADIYQNRMLLTSKRDRPEGWTLHSGLWSPFYIQLRLISSFPQTLKKVGMTMTTLLEEKAPHINKVVGIAFAGIPIATAISLESGLPACHTRKLAGVKSQDDLQKYIKEYGQHAMVEGVIDDGDALCIVDDLVTGMTSKFEARNQILAEVEQRGIKDVTCDHIAVVLDRQQGADKIALAKGLRLHSLIKFLDEGLPMLKTMMPAEEFEIISNYLKDPSAFQK